MTPVELLKKKVKMKRGKQENGGLLECYDN